MFYMKGFYIKLKKKQAFVTFNGLINSCYSNLQEKYWFERSEKIIKGVIKRLEDVHVRSDQQEKLTKLLYKLRTDCLQLIEIAIHQLNNEINEEQSTDASETERSIEDPYDETTKTFRLLFTCTLILQTERENFSNICLYLKGLLYKQCKRIRDG